MSASRIRNKKLNCSFAPLASSTISGSRLRLDLDSTRIGTSDSCGQNNNKKLDHGYNEYLQALAKKRIIATSFLHFETLLQQQICYQDHEIIKMRKEYEQKKTKLGKIIKNNELVNILKQLEGRLKEFEESTEDQNLKKLTSLSNVLGVACRELMLVGVKSFSSKEEWLSLLEIIRELSKFLQNYFRSCKSIKEFELIDDISEKFKETLELQTDLQEQIAISSSLSKTSSIKYLEKMKNLFDVMGSTTI